MVPDYNAIIRVARQATWATTCGKRAKYMSLIKKMMATFLVKYSALVRLDPSFVAPAKGPKAAGADAALWSERQLSVMEAQLAIKKESLELKKRIVSIPCSLRDVSISADVSPF